MAKKTDVPQNTPEHNASPYETRRELDPMGGEEAEAFDWVINKMAEDQPDAAFNQLVDEGIDQGWLMLRDDGAIAVNPEAPE